MVTLVYVATLHVAIWHIYGIIYYGILRLAVTVSQRAHPRGVRALAAGRHPRGPAALRAPVAPSARPGGILCRAVPSAIAVVLGWTESPHACVLVCPWRLFVSCLPWLPSGWRRVALCHHCLRSRPHGWGLGPAGMS